MPSFGFFAFFSSVLLWCWFLYLGLWYGCECVRAGFRVLWLGVSCCFGLRVGRFKGRLSRLFERGGIIRGSFTREVKMATIAVAG